MYNIIFQLVGSSSSQVRNLEDARYFHLYTLTNLRMNQTVLRLKRLVRIHRAKLPIDSYLRRPPEEPEEGRGANVMRSL